MKKKIKKVRFILASNYAGPDFPDEEQAVNDTRNYRRSQMQSENDQQQHMQSPSFAQILRAGANLSPMFVLRRLPLNLQTLFHLAP